MHNPKTLQRTSIWPRATSKLCVGLPQAVTPPSTYRVFLPNIGLEEDASVPEDPAYVVARERDEEILVHLDATTIETSAKRKKAAFKTREK